MQIEPYQRAWLQLTRPLGLVENTALIATPNEFAKDQLENRLRVLITNALSRELGRSIQLAVIIDPIATAAMAPADDPQAPPEPLGIRIPFGTSTDLGRDDEIPPRPDRQAGAQPAGGPWDGSGQGPGVNGQPPTTRQPGAATFSVPTGHFPLQPGPAGLPHLPAHRSPHQTADRADLDPQQRPGQHQGPDQLDSRRPADARTSLPGVARPTQTRLNPKYTFDTFVIGSSNRFAHAAAVAVAEAPAKAYNPLFIYGDSGLGKTHLLHAIGHYAQTLFPGLKVRYVSSEEFTNDFINMIRDGKQDGFRRRYRDVDVLLVDDIQFLENKEGTQEEFFHTFNTLHNAEKQIVISSDRAPKRLVTLEDRLRSRFEWGLQTDVQPPELETRIAILRKKAVQDRLNAPPEALEYIASRISTNIRELEGALIR